MSLTCRAAAGVCHVRRFATSASSLGAAADPYAGKSVAQLARAAVVFHVSAWQPVVDNALDLIARSDRVLGPSVTNAVLKVTLRS